ncbi:hypothetical protein ABZ816_29970 [Actinosynnema sp. NPDC047251]|uniref:Putative membrane protein n=1 Tax=Saccharothrix espanaensis (strain ATCC 51144 / DSM 44229 / JCM 9112 / NBRC 15066 / NRRL 15764) TaxID=1179773 RepID=K0KAZ5_SACES|nr:hypothetical protein [Saccharothrix espanaensis]CCH34692.1 putative membrane protein [Saccharothrix espanaensis DSM 44229]
MTVAEDWYVSSTFWAIAAVVVAVVATPIMIFVTYNASGPRRRLFFGLYKVEELPVVKNSDLGDGWPIVEKMMEDIGIEHYRDIVESPFETPHYVTVRLATRGQRDIASSHYDGGRPIVFDLGVPIGHVVKAEPRPKHVTTSVPDLVIDGTKLLIGPGLLTRKYELYVLLHVDGPPKLTGYLNLVDVDVRRIDSHGEWHRKVWTSRGEKIAVLTFSWFWSLSGAWLITLAAQAGAADHNRQLGYFDVALPLGVWNLVINAFFIWKWKSKS